MRLSQKIFSPVANNGIRIRTFGFYLGPVRLLFVVLLFGYFVMGCAPVYIPTTHNAPLFSGKGEIQTAVTAGPGVNAQAAYALSDHIGITANYLYMRREYSKNGKKHQAAEFGLGYYKNFNDNWCFEAFSGYGFGKGSAYDSVYTYGLNLPPPFPTSSDRYEARGKYNKIFLQSSVGFRKGYATFFISGKVNLVGYESIRIVHNNEQQQVRHPWIDYFSFVHGGRFRFVSDKLFFQYQAGFNVPISRNPEYDFDGLIGSVGFVFIPTLKQQE